MLLILPGCSVFGDSGVEIAPYDVVAGPEDQKIEIRNYPSMVLVSTSMAGDGRNNAFRKLFKYITGENVAADEIAMTAPVFMDEKQADNKQSGVEIAMTAPVFMDDEGDNRLMSFVMPADFTLATTPQPTDPDVKVHALENYQVAVITFNGRLTNGNINKHRQILEQWIADSDYAVNGAVKSAGYDAPFTIPSFRRNEVLIPVIKRN